MPSGNLGSSRELFCLGNHHDCVDVSSFLMAFCSSTFALTFSRKAFACASDMALVLLFRFMATIRSLVFWLKSQDGLFSVGVVFNHASAVHQPELIRACSRPCTSVRDWRGFPYRIDFSLPPSASPARRRGVDSGSTSRPSRWLRNHFLGSS